MPYNAQGEWVSDSEADANPDIAGGDTGAQIASMDLLDVFGQRAQHQRHQDAVSADRNRAYWDSIGAPTAGQLDSRQGRDAESQALAQLQQYQSGALTGADRGQLEASRQRDAQAAGSQQQSLMQQAQARGVGGSGLDFATRQQASQQGQQQASDAEAQALAMAQQRGLAATGAAASLGSTMRDEAAHGALQQSYEDQMNRAAGATGQYGTDSAMRSGRRDDEQQNRAGLLGLLGGLLG